MLSASKSGSGLATGYNLTRSLRFRSAATADLERTPSTTGTGGSKTWTYSIWLKRGLLATRQSLVDGYASSAGHVLEFTSSDTLEFYAWGGAAALDLITTQVFRDPSAYYHIVLAVDTTQATAANRIKLYINGAQVTAFSTATYPTQNALTYIGSNVLQDIGRRGSNQFYSDCYLAEVNFIDGQALTPSSFGSTNALTGVWQPAKYSGTYGTNGFYLPFTDNSALTTSSNVGLGKDFSGNGNYWTTNNISITAGVTYDSMTDVPTLTSATAANFATLNPLNSYSVTVVNNGNLNLSLADTGGARTTFATFGLTSGKWYWEVSVTTVAGTYYPSIGVNTDLTLSPANQSGVSALGFMYMANGQKYNSGALAAYGSAFSSGTVVGVALDMGAGTITFYNNNTSQGTAFTGITGTAVPCFSGYNSAACAVNFGQRPFAYTPPTGFVALNTYNLPTSTIVKGNTVMDATLYTGTLLSNAITNAASFKPDLVWLKSRSAATDNKLTDSVRGVTKGLISNTTGAETTDTQGLTAFNTNGFTVGTNTDYNNLAATYVAWQWQAGQGSSSSNTNGTITSTVSVNASAGFSVVTYTGTAVAATVGHGLGVAPSWIVVKGRTNVSDWRVYHSAVTLPNVLNLNTTSAAASDSGAFGSTAPTSSVFTLGTGAGTNGSTNTYVAYCWTPIAGFSAFGSYTGNGSTDGTFVYTGFRPKFVMLKLTSSAAGWIIYDSVRDTYNVEQNLLRADLANAEVQVGLLDFVSNGFKFRSYDAGVNGAGGTYIYAAFAENPTKYALAR